ncbi:nicotinate phosphoribosyltransferase [Parachitinimonas caeni]|uniref:Nicotinamide phosphoribosyltransferase n=1 Tax=Parachitinimonas caeni TaxID=3031301 RepID=A0ABT7E559_9NEIS|nr:nicotinate phosphoribosyltransferase [Parachitinimonas caeni]MDK2126057.1 nicotinate phosphoribosyltransferase [Parachitinimonas caeni]
MMSHSTFGNLILSTDSYKTSHYRQYPEGANAMYSYVESRGGSFDKVLFFGLQAILKQYLSQPLTEADIDEAREVLAMHGLPFNEAGFRRIIDVHGGYMPIRIWAVPEGSIVDTSIPLMAIESTDPELFWLVSYLETLLLRVWYPTTVATQSWHIRQMIGEYLRRTADDTSGLAFKLHDFGARGVSSQESAALGGMAHLVNFYGTDTLVGLLAARRYYNAPAACGYSIPAAEHSTITSWGREDEFAAYRNMLEEFAQPGKLVAVVSDSYDIFRAVQEGWGGELRQQVIDSGATLVVRPDSGDPVEVVAKVVRLLDQSFGHTINRNGFKLLKHVRVIQGDGVDKLSIRMILGHLEALGYSADNVAFGMGGALLQQVHRDTQKFAMKCSAIRVGDVWRDVYKEPITDQGKKSKRGRIAAYKDANGWRSGLLDPSAPDLAMQVVWENGKQLLDDDFDTIRRRANSDWE